MYTDEALDLWGDMFVLLGIGEALCITFCQFLADPRRYLRELELFGLPASFRDAGHAAASRIAVTEYEALLPKQDAVRLRLQMDEHLERDIPAAREIEHLPRRNGTPVEALSHHRHPRHYNASMFHPKKVEGQS